MRKAPHIAVFTVGLLIPARSIDDGLAALLVTFFGLVAAGTIPAMSLLSGSVMSPTRSVARLITLKASLDTLLRQLSGMLYASILGAVAVIVLVFGVPSLPIGWLPVPDYLSWLMVFAADFPERALQALVLLALFVAGDRIRVIKLTFKMALKARFELALEEARRRTDENAPSAEDVSEAFSTPPGFGAKVPFSR